MALNLLKDPNAWQTAYTRDQAHKESGSHSSHSNLVIGLAALFVWIFLLFLLINRLNVLLSLSLRTQAALAFALLIVVIVPFMAVYSCAIHFAAEFLAEYYQPPNEMDLRKLINYRLAGVPKLPPPLSFIFQFQYILVKDGEIIKSDQWPAWMARRLGGPLILIIFDGSALYLERGNRFSRVVGPGEKIPFLEWYETVKYVVDLRPKMRCGTIDVWTKDGLHLNLEIQMECRIGDPKKRSLHPNLIYPFDPEAVKLAIERHSVRWPDRTKGDPKEFDWIDSAWGQATGILPGYIGSRMLDDLLIADRNGGQILSPTAVQEIYDDLNRKTKAFGVYVTDFQVLKVILPPEAESVLKESWKTEKQTRATIKDGEMKAATIRMREQARAKAQHDLIINIADGLIKDSSKDHTEPILMLFSRILDENLDDPLLRAYLAHETLETLEKIREILNQ
jgi:regulator of protease activity HflC (stomatin/prohibitin superfamily)